MPIRERPRPSHAGESGPFRVSGGGVLLRGGWTGYALTFKAEAEPCGHRSPGPSSQKTRRPPPPLCDMRPRQLDPPCFGASGAMALGLAVHWRSLARRFGRFGRGVTAPS